MNIPESFPEGFRDDKVLEKLEPQGRSAEFLNISRALIDLLTSKERDHFIAHPVRFFSKDLAFRGMSLGKMQKTLETGEFPVQQGMMGSEAVFLSNSSFSSFLYSPPESGALAVLDRSKLKLASERGIITLGSPEYTQVIDEIRSRLRGPLTPDRLYGLDNGIDVAVPADPRFPLVRNLEMRRPQTLDSALCFLVFENGEFKVVEP